MPKINEDAMSLVIGVLLAVIALISGSCAIGWWYL